TRNGRWPAVAAKTVRARCAIFFPIRRYQYNLSRGDKHLRPGGIRAVLACATALILTAACSSEKVRAAAVKAEKERKVAADFTLKDVNGRTVHLSEYRGKVVLLNFWATWCGPCKIEIPWFMQFEQEMKDRGFAVLGVAMDDEGWEA